MQEPLMYKRDNKWELSLEKDENVRTRSQNNPTLILYDITEAKAFNILLL